MNGHLDGRVYRGGSLDDGLEHAADRAAYRAGLARSEAATARARARGRPDADTSDHLFDWKPTPEEQRHTDGMSAVAESFVARRLGRRWLSSGLVPDDPHAGDVEGGISVRWTWRPRGSLIIHPRDWDGLVGVLVVGGFRFPAEQGWIAPQLLMAGWLPVPLSKRREWWRTRGVRHPAYFVPYVQLYSMGDLPIALREVEP